MSNAMHKIKNRP